mmetsp:Transcript_40086/g.100841  ORF Transcript_40086/g.100841 Transcript_40086/m.100841 type:complete len:211 (+) Transcript_40086:125-757(+)
MVSRARPPGDGGLACPASCGPGAPVGCAPGPGALCGAGGLYHAGGAQHVLHGRVLSGHWLGEGVRDGRTIQHKHAAQLEDTLGDPLDLLGDGGQRHDVHEVRHPLAQVQPRRLQLHLGHGLADVAKPRDGVCLKRLAVVHKRERARHLWVELQKLVQLGAVAHGDEDRPHDPGGRELGELLGPLQRCRSAPHRHAHAPKKHCTCTTNIAR